MARSVPEPRSQSNYTVLDLGCGSGQPIADYLIGLGHNVTGVYPSPHLIELCKMRYPSEQEYRKLQNLNDFSLLSYKHEDKNCADHSIYLAQRNS